MEGAVEATGAALFAPSSSLSSTPMELDSVGSTDESLVDTVDALLALPRYLNRVGWRGEDHVVASSFHPIPPRDNIGPGGGSALHKKRCCGRCVVG